MRGFLQPHLPQTAPKPAHARLAAKAAGLLTLLSICLHAQAQTVALPTPQNGIWVVKQEAAASPKRNLSIDVQDGVLLAQIADYDSDGNPTFQVTAGTLHADAEQPNAISTMKAPLQRYRDGRSIGGPAQAAVLDGNAGEIRLRFSSSYEGTAEFPGQAPVAIERLQLDTRRLANPDVQTVDAYTGHLHQVQGPEDVLRDSAFHLRVIRQAPSGQVQLQLRVSQERIPEPLTCEADSSSPAPDNQPALLAARETQWHCTGNATNEDITADLRIRLVANEVVGHLQYHRTNLAGASQQATAQLRGIRRFYETNNVRTGESLYYAYSATDVQYVVPQSGIWVIPDELNGQPGRGFAIDVDGDTLVLEVFGYDEAGDATFHIGTSPFIPGTISQVQLQQPSSTHLKSPGTASLSFDSLTSGTIALPGEPARKIVRFALSGPPDVRSLQGLWRFNIPGRGAISVQLNTLKDNAIESSDGLFRCEFVSPAITQDAGDTLCTQYPAAHEADQSLRQFVFQWQMDLSDLYGQYFHTDSAKREGTGISRIAYPGKDNAAQTYFAQGSAIHLPLRTAP
ncbi:hypothetical protein E9531_07740 [Lampropedia puyangensis]|uniref:Uncharacterized protein n=1 Tax=Lampropedia puyangensis TaxID=1330072 RepID=A0A4S8F550_9BURK|nr:hypothetical protein [Lampropedia puyangensis]THU02558.1 hypothetical protein E9531_07740 [Lampropedia puyangensis]